MFTGIVEHTGTIVSKQALASGLRFVIQTQFQDLVLGESVAVDGICLTVTGFAKGEFSCDVSPETLSLTCADGWESGARVNLERALRLSDRIGGHWVSGHVDGKVRVKERQDLSEFTRMSFSGVSADHAQYVLKKGSVTVNGVSLTINGTYADGFEVMLIPHTLQITNLNRLVPGTEVNVEFDWMTKVILQDASRRLEVLKERT